MKQPKPRSENYNSLITYVRAGHIQIPKFQRDFVWAIEDTGKLLDSILKGYPIGTFILWKTRDRLSSVKNLGGADLPMPPEGDYVNYVLDGQQRLASLFVVLEGLKSEREGKQVDYKNIYVRLEGGQGEDGSIVSSEQPNGKWIKVYDLLSNNLSFFVNNYREDIDKIQEYRERFTTYEFSTIVLEDYPIEDAVETFTRINTTGTALTLFEIMAAKTYDEAQGFDLQEKHAELQEDLERVGYDTIPSSVILQCLSMNLKGDCRRSTILKLEKNEVIRRWEETVDSITESIDYLRTSLRIPASRLLPFGALLVPLAYFFHRAGDKPKPEQEKLLQEYFWRASLSYRYSAAAETRLGQDAKRIEQIIDGKRPGYDFNVLLDKEELKNWWFSTGDSYCKAILCLLASFKPRSFRNNGDVILDNSWLKQSNSRNYHHFFPSAYLQKRRIGNDNSLVNVTLVDDYLNKKEIRARAPSDYMRKFKEANSRLADTMKSHLIDDLDDFGVWSDDYEKFLDRRSERIVEELKTRIAG